MWIFVSVVFFILFVVSIVVIINMLKKVELYEDFCNTILDEAQNILLQMKRIDLRGSFETDDEVGLIFEGIKELVFRLRAFVEKEE